MKQTKKIASELLAQIERDFFEGAGLAKASLLKGDERRTYKLVQVERLLTEKFNYASLAICLSDKFWTADEGRTSKLVSTAISRAASGTTINDFINRAICNELNNLEVI